MFPVDGVCQLESSPTSQGVAAKRARPRRPSSLSSSQQKLVLVCTRAEPMRHSKPLLGWTSWPVYLFFNHRTIDHHNVSKCTTRVSAPVTYKCDFGGKYISSPSKVFELSFQTTSLHPPPATTFSNHLQFSSSSKLYSRTLNFPPLLL